MSGPFSDVGNTIFTNKSVLTESYQPDTILERDEEIEAYSHALQDILFGREPENIFLYGKAGLGKTGVTTYMMNELLAEWIPVLRQTTSTSTKSIVTAERCSW